MYMHFCLIQPRDTKNPCPVCRDALEIAPVPAAPAWLPDGPPPGRARAPARGHAPSAAALGHVVEVLGAHVEWGYAAPLHRWTIAQWVCPPMPPPR